MPVLKPTKLISCENLPITDAKLLVTRVFKDNRGSFEVFWETELLDSIGVTFQPSNAHHSYNTLRHTLRGIHFQKSPYGQTKLVSCVSGRVLDVIVDLREDSSTFGQWHATEMSAASGRAVLIPAGCGHAFLTLEEHTTIAYLIAGEYLPDAGRVLNWNDPHVGVQWPCDTPVMSEKDRAAPSWDQCEF